MRIALALVLLCTAPAFAQDAKSPFAWARSSGFGPPIPSPTLFYHLESMSGAAAPPPRFLAVHQPGRVFLPQNLQHPVGKRVERMWLLGDASTFMFVKDYVIGITTFEEVAADLPLLESIVPPQSGMILLQKRTGDGTNGSAIVYYFDSETKLLIDSHRSFWFCGFCPHILVRQTAWQLQGKMLAGCIGKERRGPDAMVLRGLESLGGTLDIRLANWAPEVEHLDDIALGIVPLRDGEDIELDRERKPWLVTQSRLTVPFHLGSRRGKDTWIMDRESSKVGNVLILELRNTGDFEAAMRDAVFNNRPWPDADLTVRFDTGETIILPPVGTKFPRRIAIPIPAASSNIILTGPAARWHIRRAWLAHGAPACDVVWIPAPMRPAALQPLDQVDLTFAIPPAVQGRAGAILRMTGHYDFVDAAPDVLDRLRNLRFSPASPPRLVRVEP